MVENWFDELSFAPHGLKLSSYLAEDDSDS